MAIVMRLIEWANGRPLGVAGQFVKSVDVQKADIDINWLSATKKLEEARVWTTLHEAMKTYNEVLRSDPIRADGQPNRPLTAITVSIEVVIILRNTGEQDGDETNPVE